MSVVITMAGAGSRFSNEGYTVPKYRVIARNKTLFDWSLISLQNFFETQRFVFACLEEHDQQFIADSAQRLGIKDFIIHTRKSISKGQAETALDCLDLVDQSEAVWIFNIDTYVDEGFSPSDINNAQGCIHVFYSDNPNMSFVRYDDSGHVIEVAEKKVISTWATVGMYGFESALLYKKLYEHTFLQNKDYEVKGERYIAPMYQLLLKQGGVVVAPRLKDPNVHILGTPYDVQLFDSNAVPPIGSI